mmetsp:Transcript_6298/g.7262  ORF Transcript_6298/g.7262 Transcript_6298/m.7262 type:complete len:130 (-) Transcript_6298:201-590(-)
MFSASATYIGWESKPCKSHIWNPRVGTGILRYICAMCRTRSTLRSIRGTFHKVMTDLIHLIASLVEPGSGKNSSRASWTMPLQLREEERKLYHLISKDSCKEASVHDTLLSEDKIESLMNRWRFLSRVG